MNSYVSRILKGVAGGLVILVLIFTVNRWLGDYQEAKKNAPSSITTQTVTPADNSKKADEKDDKKKESSSQDKDEPKQKQKVVVLIDGLNFRAKPDSAAEPIRGLNKGTELTLLKKQNGWYQVEDDDGTKGWVSSKSSYTKLK